MVTFFLRLRNDFLQLHDFTTTGAAVESEVVKLEKVVAKPKKVTMKLKSVVAKSEKS